MDDIDVANDQAAAFIDLSLRAARSKPQAAVSSGICRVCHADIELQRLKANPTAALCCECAEEAELLAIRIRRTGQGH